MQRHQMIIRHEKELDQIKRMISRKEEELLKRQTIERRALPKRIRAERKARDMMFRESLRISMTTDPELEREKLKKFQEQEKKRYTQEQVRFETKHSKQLEELRATSDGSIRELEQLQNEKRKQLLEHETAKLRDCDEGLQKELREWKSQLLPRKQSVQKELDRMVNEYEFKWGGPVDRREFDGEFVVPPEIRNRTNSLNSRSLRLHGGLLSISRSRTFLSLPVANGGGRSSIHSSVPDLSRSVPNTPGSAHKLSLASSYDSVLEENENEGGEQGGGQHQQQSAIKYIFTDDGVHLRRKSEDILSGRRTKIPVKSQGRPYQENGGRPSMPPMQQYQQNHSRQHSEPSNRLVPIRVNPVKKPGNFFEAMTNRSSSAAVPQYSGGTMPRSGAYGWGHSRLGTNNFSSDANISKLSTFSSARGGLPLPPDAQYRNGGNEPHRGGVVNPGMKLSPSTPILLSPGKESDSAA